MIGSLDKLDMTACSIDLDHWIDSEYANAGRTRSCWDDDTANDLAVKLNKIWDAKAAVRTCLQQLQPMESPGENYAEVGIERNLFWQKLIFQTHRLDSDPRQEFSRNFGKVKRIGVVNRGPFRGFKSPLYLDKGSVMKTCQECLARMPKIPFLSYFLKKGKKVTHYLKH